MGGSDGINEAESIRRRASTVETLAETKAAPRSPLKSGCLGQADESEVSTAQRQGSLISRLFV
jgi:hypothetical protein